MSFTTTLNFGPEKLIERWLKDHPATKQIYTDDKRIISVAARTFANKDMVVCQVSSHVFALRFGEEINLSEAKTEEVCSKLNVALQDWPNLSMRNY